MHVTLGQRIALIVVALTCCATAAARAEDPRDYWAFRHLARVDVPSVRAKERVRTPVDAFVLSKLESRGLTLAREASRQVLVRRAFIDLVGLPPSPDEVAQFVDDPAPDAY